jgi:cytochrome c biogenesis protein CcdA
MTLTDNEGYVILVAMLTALLVGFATRRAALCFLPLLGVGGFLAYTLSSNDRYSQIPEDVQVTVVYALGLSAAMILLGVVVRRIVDAERLRRRPGT